MASASLRSDGCSYKEKLRQTTGPGIYQLNRPANDCGPCGQDIPNDPYLRWQAWGPGFCAPGSTVDDSSELLGLPYKTTKCADQLYSPFKPAGSGRGVCAAPSGDGRANNAACHRPTEPTRLSNPPCTLRGTGWNRWEWLCYDPQDRALIPFEHNVNYRMVVKDNHVPCIPAPVDASNAVPGAAPVSNKPSASVSEGFQNWSAPEEASYQPWAMSPVWNSCVRSKELGA